MAGSVSATTLAGVGLGLSAIGTGVGVMGQLQQASAASAAAKYQSEVAAGNQTIANQNASFASAEGEQQAAMSEQKTRATEGAILAGQASSGVDVNSPTSKGVRASETELGQLDADTIRANAARQAYGYETQATNFQNQASADTSQAQNYAISGPLNSGGSLLSGVGNASTNYANVMGKASGMNAAAYINSSPQQQVAQDVAE